MNRSVKFLMLAQPLLFAGCGEGKKNDVPAVDYSVRKAVDTQTDSVQRADVRVDSPLTIQSTVSGAVQSERRPLIVAVAPVTCIETAGVELLRFQNKLVDEKEQQSLSLADRLTVSRTMQGLVKTVDAIDGLLAREMNRGFVAEDNARDYAVRKALYEKMMQAPNRPVLAGSAFLGGFLGDYPQFFRVLDEQTAAKGAVKLEKDSSPDALRRFGLYTGATHLLTVMVSDIKTRQQKFKGYGVETEQTVFELPVTVKLVDLQRQIPVFSQTFTGRKTQMRTPSVQILDDGTFTDVLHDALKNISGVLAQDVQRRYAEMVPARYGLSFKLEGAETGRIFVDGQFKAMNGERFDVDEGLHDFSVEASGCETKHLRLNVEGGAEVTVRMK